jgi:hypothetical protein
MPEMDQADLREADGPAAKNGPGGLISAHVSIHLAVMLSGNVVRGPVAKRERQKAAARIQAMKKGQLRGD